MNVVIEVGTITSRIIGTLPAEQLEPLRYHLSYEEAGAYFRRQRNRFAQDRKYLITEKRQEFRTGLLRRVCSLCETLGIEFELRDLRLVAEADHFMGLNLDATMRPYQQEAIDIAILERTGMLRVATGGGKTRIASGIAATLERKAVILVHRRDLMRQVLDTLHDLMLYPEVIGQVGDGVYEPNLITVATVQTVCAALRIDVEQFDDTDGEEPTGALAHEGEIRAMLDEAQVVIVDEAHHAPAKTISLVLRHCVNATWRLGMSATDWRDDGADLLIEAAIGPRIYDVSLTNLVELGFLVPAKIVMSPMLVPDTLCHAETFLGVYRHFYVDSERFHLQTFAANDWFYKQGAHILTLVTAIKHGERLRTLHDAEGIPSAFLSGKDSTSRRAEILRDVRSGALRHLIGTSIADEGLDMPILDTLNLAGGGKSTTKAYQRIGRTLRPAPGKVRANIIDYRCREDETLKKHAGRRASVYRKEPCFAFTEIRP